MITLNEAHAVLERFLAAPERNEDCFDLDRFYGALTAVLSCPESTDEFDFCSLVLRDDAEGAAQWFDDDQLRLAWVKCWNALDEDLVMERFDLHRLYPQVAAQQAPTEKFSQWCRGYMLGYLLTEQDWREAHDFLIEEGVGETEENQISLLALCVVVADWEASLVDNDDPDKLKRNLSMLFDAIHDGVNNTYKLALILKENLIRSDQERQPVVRSEPKVGRNDPCPCGSGRKYKKCCLKLQTEKAD